MSLWDTLTTFLNYENAFEPEAKQLFSYNRKPADELERNGDRQEDHTLKHSDNGQNKESE